jgi:hypothetical protein
MSDIEADVRKSTDGYFKNHSIVELSRDRGFGSWRCSKHGVFNFSFTITVIPGSLILTGDLGNLIVTRHGTPMIPWCRGAVDSTLYFAQKTGGEFTKREFSIDKYREWLVTQVAEHTTSDCDDFEANAIGNYYRDVLDDGIDEFTERDAYDNLHARHGDDGEVASSWQDWNRQFLVKRDAIRWFVMNYVESTTKGGGV